MRKVITMMRNLKIESNDEGYIEEGSQRSETTRGMDCLSLRSNVRSY